MVRRADAIPPHPTPTDAKQRTLAKNAKSAAPGIKAASISDPPRKNTNPRKGASERQVPMSKSEEPLPEEVQIVFGENLKAARLKSGLKQSDVAEQAGVTQQRLSQIENGQQNVTLKTMVKLAAVVNHNVSALLSKVKAKRAR